MRSSPNQASVLLKMIFRTTGNYSIVLSRAFLVMCLTHWSWVTHICVSKVTIIGSDNGLSPAWGQAIICTNAGLLLIGIWGTNFSEILSEIHTFSFKKMYLKTSSAKGRPFCLGLNVLTHRSLKKRLPFSKWLFQSQLSSTVFWYKFHICF